MKIKFTGLWELPDEDAPDDRGSVDLWLIRHIAAMIEEGPETDDVYDNLYLRWEIVE